MNEMTKVFEGNNLRVINEMDQVWFVLSDVCNVLGLSNPTVAATRLDEDEVTKFNLGSQRGEVLLVNEFGLYNLVLGSRKKEAKAFKRWVTHDVLPSIRQTGGYQVKPKSELELIQMTATEMIKTNERIDVIEDKLNNKMTIDYGQQLAIENAKKKRVEYLWARMQEDGGSELYDTKRKVYGRIGSDLKKVFAVPSYRNIKDADFFEAMNYIAAWRPALV